MGPHIGKYMNHKAVKAMRMAATITLVVCGSMAMSGENTSGVRSTDAAAGAEIAKPVAGLLIPARTRLIMDYKRIALA